MLHLSQLAYIHTPTEPQMKQPIPIFVLTLDSPHWAQDNSCTWAQDNSCTYAGHSTKCNMKLHVQNSAMTQSIEAHAGLDQETDRSVVG